MSTFCLSPLLPENFLGVTLATKIPPDAIASQHNFGVTYQATIPSNRLPTIFIVTMTDNETETQPKTEEAEVAVDSGEPVSTLHRILRD